jgi:UDP-glucose 4-epimerase
MEKLRIIVTGSAGFMGSWIADELTKQGHQVLGVDNLSGGFLRNTKEHNFVCLDLRDKYATERLVEQFRPQVLFALAANARECASFFQPIDVTEANLYAYINILEPCIKYGIKKIVYFSSMSRYGDGKPPFDETYSTKPIDVYASNKVAAEEITKQLAGAHNFDWTVVVPRNVFGERQSLRDRFRNFIGITINHILRNEDVVVYGDGKQVRSFSYIKNSLDCYLQCLEEKTNNQIINIGGLIPKTIKEVAEIIISNFPNYKGKIVHLPDRYGEVKYAWATFAKSVELLEYKEEISLEEGIKNMCKWGKIIGACEWSKDKLSLINDKVPSTWR